MKYNEFQVAQKFETEHVTITKEEIIDFAQKYDPQFMHVDEKKAGESKFGSIIASGMHTVSLAWNSWVKLGVFGDDVIAGVGIDNVKFRKPVFPNDCLSVKIEIVEMKQKNPDCGTITLYMATYNQKKELVLEAKATGLIQV